MIGASLIPAFTLSQTLPQFSNGNSDTWYYIIFNNNSAVTDTGESQELRNRTPQEDNNGQLWRFCGHQDSCIVESKAGQKMLFRQSDKRFYGSSSEATAMKLVPNSAGKWELQIANTSLAPASGSVALVMNGGSGFDKYLDLWKHDFAACGLDFTAMADMNFDFQTAPDTPDEVYVDQTGKAPDQPLSLWYRAPAKNWVTEALPIGNGETGAMIFGGIAQDRIQFNHKSLWKGSKGANDLGSYLAFGDIYLTNLAARSATGYVRHLDLTEGIVNVGYNSQSTAYHREYLASNPDGVIAVRYTADGTEGLSFDLRFINAQGNRAVYTPDGASFGGRLTNGMNYRAELRIEQKGGKVNATNSAVIIESANEITLYLACATDFDPSHPNHLTGDTDSMTATLTETLDKAVTLGFDEIRNRHTADYSSLFDRVNFSLPNASCNAPTDILLRQNTEASKAMVDILVFQYGRYLTIASSRGLALPSNLQGIWNKDGNASSNAVWASDIHSNINVQMNYWPAEPTNLSECHMPFLQFIENEATRNDGTWQANAKALGASKGWVVNTAGNIFGGSSDYKAGKYSVVNAWYCQHLWQHFAYTCDTTYLRTMALPLMKSACEFWFDRLVESKNGDGTLECPNEYSPEQGRVQNATAHAQQLVTELFENTLTAIKTLGPDSDCDENFKSTLTDKLTRLDKGLHIASDGMLREWKYQENTPNQPADTNHFLDDEANVWQCHRHTSHLMALYPGFNIDLGIDPDIFTAAVKSLDDRGDMSTGWARAWRISLWARARDAARTYTTLRGFAHFTEALTYDWHGGLYANMLDAHATSVFQIEGNFGATAGIAEMLLQSRPDSLVLLPALPAAWADGQIRGLKAIGNFEVDLEWADGKLLTATLHSHSGGAVAIAYPGITDATVNGSPYSHATTNPNLLTIDTEKGRTYTIDLSNGSGIRAVTPPQADGVRIEGRRIVSDSPVNIFDTMGRRHNQSTELPSGIYLVRTAAGATRIIAF